MRGREAETHLGGRGGRLRHMKGGERGPSMLQKGEAQAYERP